MNTHRAVIEYAVPPRIELVASGDPDFCGRQLAKWLARYPLTPYDDADVGSGGVAYILEVKLAVDAEQFSLVAAAVVDSFANMIGL